MDGIRPGECMLWKPAGGGVSAEVTVVALDLEKDKALVHVRRKSTGTCAQHWVDMGALSEAPSSACPCGCATRPQAADHRDPENHDAA